MTITETKFSEDRKFRYTCWRNWGGDSNKCHAFVAFICLNPSTADETLDDPTVRRCIDFSKRWGYSAFCMLNLFAFRATKPKDMKACSDPIGADNDRWLIDVSSKSAVVVAAWGNDGDHLGRDVAVRKLMADSGVTLHHLKLTSKNQPWHPLYLPKTLTPKPL